MKEFSVTMCNSAPKEVSLSAHKGGLVDSRGFARYVGDRVEFGRLTLSVEVVWACSLRCPGCWVGMARPSMWTARPGESMAPALLAAALSFGRELGISRLTLLGGEPTLHPRLSSIIRSATTAGYQVSVTTNGVCSSRGLVEILGSGLKGISFSLDGSRAQIHDALRPSPNGRSTFHMTLESLRHAVQHRSEGGYKVTVNHTIYPRNLHDAESMIRLSASLGVDRIRLHFTLPGDFPEPDGRITYIDPGKWLALWSRISDLIRELGVPIATVQGYGLSALGAARKRKSPYLNIQPDGTILICGAYARFHKYQERSAGRLLPTGAILLNPFVARAPRMNHCCGAVPGLLAGLPGAVRNVIERAGGLGCIILDGSLVEPSVYQPLA